MTSSIAQRSQKTKTESTDEKAYRLPVLELTPIVAVVRGDTETYRIWMDTLTCECMAAQNGRTCSHVKAALLERAKRANQRLELLKGYAPGCHSFNGYYWFEWPLPDALTLALLAASRPADVLEAIDDLV